MSPLSGDVTLAGSYLRQFHQAQQLRFRTYKQLTQGFDNMLESKQEAPYRELLAQATVAFQVCSETVNAAETGLREMKCLDMADILRVLQLNEKEKLRLTLILQALKQSYSKRSFSWQESHVGDHAEERTVRAASEGSCHCCTTAEPTQEEFAAAKAEALQGLQIAIDNINDALEELKYAEAEFSEQDNL